MSCISSHGEITNDCDVIINSNLYVNTALTVTTNDLADVGTTSNGADLTEHGTLEVRNEGGGADVIIEGGSSNATIQLNSGSVTWQRRAAIGFAHNYNTKWEFMHRGYTDTNFVLRSKNGGSWTEQLILHWESGNTGIGTNAPAEKMHVAGNARIAGTVWALPAGDFAMGSYTNGTKP